MKSEEMARSAVQESDLFRPYPLGPLTLANRIVMAPLTRARAVANDVPGPYSAKYYSERATAGLIITEATNISKVGKGYAFTPGIYNEEQMTAWKLTTEAVHREGGLIFLQLWHVGRISHPLLQPRHALPVAPSAIKPKGQAYTETGYQPMVTPRALTLSEIPQVIQEYVEATQYAKLAGFDGVEIHAANGYLLDQFIQDKTNQRTDAYGGSLENRIRFVLEVVAAVVNAWSSSRVGIRLSPVSHLNDIDDSNPMKTFGFLVQQLNQFNLAYLHCVEGLTIGPREIPEAFSFKKLRDLFHGTYMANNGYDLSLALKARRENTADLISFGQAFIGNPDLVRRFYTGAKLMAAPRETWYGGGAAGYIDWPRAE